MARECVGNQYVQLDQAAQSVRFARPGLEINLGSIGKGYALDRAAELLEQQGVHDFLLHGGSSSVLARGSHAADGEGSGWSVGVRNPLRPQLRLGQLKLDNRALATSGSGTQFFVHEGQRYGHILDPRSGWPARGVLSVSTLASTAAEADALSTAFYVMGPEAAAAYCQTHPEIGFVMICPGERAGSLSTHVGGLEAGQWIEAEEPPPG
jgi:thiamine biosynthesis lipoprotein